jgi:CRISPR/Cas system CMR-associated protein Cmr1 (group 7 of RAMP superfamily)
MITNKRLEKIKKVIEKKKGKLIVIKFEDGSELKVMPNVIHDSFTSLIGNEDGEDYENLKVIEFIKAIEGKEIVSCSGLEKLISILQQLNEYKGEPLEE